MKKKAIPILIILMMVVACAHAPTPAQKALHAAQKVDAVANEVMKAAPAIIAESLKDPHLYNQAAKAYNDSKKIVQEYDRLVQIAEQTGQAPTTETVMKIVKLVFDFIHTLKELGVPVEKLEQKALAFYGGE